jgi:hypothetical protein
MRSRLKLFAVLAATLVAALASAQTWSPFQWGSAAAYGKQVAKARVYLPIEISGLSGTHRALLDTTSARSYLYGDLARRLANGSPALPSPAQSGVTRARLSFKLGSFAFPPTLLHIHESAEPPPSAPDEPATVAVIGLDVLQARTWIVDYPRARFSILDEGAALPKQFADRMVFWEATQRDGRLFIPMSGAGNTVADFVFDSTMGMFPVLTTMPLWQKLTGRWGDEKNNQRIGEKGDGTEIWYVGYRTAEPVRFGGRPLARTVVFTLTTATQPSRAETLPAGTNGLIGNQPFAGATVVFDLAHNRMGAVGPGRKPGL